MRGRRQREIEGLLIGLCTKISIKGANIKIQGGLSLKGNMVVHKFGSIEQVVS